jgi:hypothetical protein
MLSEPMIFASAELLGVAIVALVGLRGWQGWLAFKEHELERDCSPRTREPDAGSALGAARIELSDLKERIRKLEAIASGVDL